MSEEVLQELQHKANELGYRLAKIPAPRAKGAASQAQAVYLEGAIPKFRVEDLTDKKAQQERPDFLTCKAAHVKALRELGLID